jgi:hypothetical protein
MVDCRKRAAIAVVGETKVTGKRQVYLATGRVLQFDQTRGCWFVTAQDGGDGIFLHASVFNGYSDMLIPQHLPRITFQGGPL